MKRSILTGPFAAIALAALAGAPGNAGGEVLYNGIRLPEQWPPRYAEPAVAAEMPVPYLVNKPAEFP